MTITCPHCGFSAEVPEDRIPADATEATCPRCKASFALQGETVTDATETTAAGDQTVCPACGHSQPAGAYCIACGIDYAKWQRRQHEGDPPPLQEQATCPFCGHVQAPVSHCLRCGGVMSSTAISATVAYAGFWIRVAAAIVDSIAVWILQMVLTVIFGAMVGLIVPGVEGESFTSIVLLALFSTAISMAYYVVFTGACGQTPGKMLLRLKVVRRDGSSLTYGRAALREIPGKFVSGITLGVGYLMVAFDAHKQGLHDKIADTCVIHV